MTEFIDFLQWLVNNLHIIAKLLGAIMVFICGAGVMGTGGHAFVRLGGCIGGIFLMLFASPIVDSILSH